MNAQIEIPALLERSFADAIARIEADQGHPPDRCAQWCSALRKTAEALGKLPEEVPARWIAIRFAVGALHAVALRIEPKTLANRVAHVKAALVWFAGETGVPKRGTSLTQAWATLMDAIGADHDRVRLRNLARYCSAAGIEPAEADASVVDRFWSYRAEHTSLNTGRGKRRELARSWNACSEWVPGWPELVLEEPPLPAKGLALDDLPPGLRSGIEAHLESLTRVRRNHRGKRLKSCRTSTIRTRRAELMAYIGKAMSCGFPLHTLASLSELLRPEIVEAVLDAYWRDCGETPSSYTIQLSWKLLQLARSLDSFPAADLERLEEIRAELEQYRQPGLTEKNRAVIRQVLVDEVWRSVMRVPKTLLAEAAGQKAHAPVHAAVNASLAVAIRILTVAPIRVGNLARIRIGENLVRPDGPRGPYWLVFPDYTVKNRVPLEFELDAQTTELIDRYLAEFRAALFRGSTGAWLFPGDLGNHKDPKTLSDQITGRVVEKTGVRLTGHQFRHAAAAILLKHRPGEYELVRRLLGHRSIATTMTFYAGLETLQATRIFGEIVERELKQELQAQERVRRRNTSAMAFGRRSS